MGRKVQQRHAGRSALQQVSLEIRVPEEQLARPGQVRAMARASSAEAGSGLLSSAPPSSIAAPCDASWIGERE